MCAYSGKVRFTRIIMTEGDDKLIIAGSIITVASTGSVRSSEKRDTTVSSCSSSSKLVLVEQNTVSSTRHRSNTYQRYTK